MASAEKINWFCPACGEETPHLVESQDGEITCLECLESIPITEEIEAQLEAQVLDAQH